MNYEARRVIGEISFFREAVDKTYAVPSSGPPYAEPSSGPPVGVSDVRPERHVLVILPTASDLMPDPLAGRLSVCQTSDLNVRCW